MTTDTAITIARRALISAEADDDVILRCVRGRPVRRSYPRRMAALVWLLDAVTAIRIWFA
jgi:hypothetical protein